MGSVDSLSANGSVTRRAPLAETAREILENGGELALLAFDTRTDLPSALVHLRPRTGEKVARGGGTAGRVVVVNEEPVLVDESSSPRVFTIHGHPGSVFAIERSLALEDGDWTVVQTHTQLSPADRIEPDGAESSAFYRVFPPQPGMLASTAEGGWVVFGSSEVRKSRLRILASSLRTIGFPCLWPATFFARAVTFIAVAATYRR